MNILIITQYYWPENFKINTLAQEFTKNGHKVTVLTGIPNYPTGKFFPGYSFFNNKIEYKDEIKIIRSKVIRRYNSKGYNLFLNYFSFALFSSLKIFFLKKEYDAIFVYQPSPITVGIPALIAKYCFKIPIFFWVQDLWPQSLTDAGGVKNKLILKIAEKLTQLIYKHSDIILIQSEGFREYIRNQGVKNEKIHFLPNPTEKFYKIEQIRKLYKDKFKIGFNIIFAGNIGEAQDFENIISAADIVKSYNQKVYWNIFGDGRFKKYYENKVIELGLQENFFFKGSVESTEMPYYFACADVLLVSLKESKIFNLTIPAKLQSYLACGKPIIGSILGNGAKIILDSNSGFTSMPGNPNELSKIVLKMANLETSIRNKFGDNARSYYEKHFDSDLLYNKLESLMKSNLY